MLGLIPSGVSCHDAAKRAEGKFSSKPRKCLTGWVHAARSNIGWSSVKSLRVKKQASSWKTPPPPVRIPAAETPINAEVLRGNWIAK